MSLIKDSNRQLTYYFRISLGKNGTVHTLLEGLAGIIACLI